MNLASALAALLLLATAPSSSSAHYASHPSDGPDGRAPTYQDFDEVFTEVDEWIEASDCPDTPDPAAWNGPNHNGTDCEWILRERNPDALGSRLLRHAFHDAVGGFDGYVDLTNKDNRGLEASDDALRRIYNEYTFLSDGKPLKNVLSFADLTAWAGHTSVIRAAFVHERNERVNQGNEDFEAIIPSIPVKWGRLDWIPSGPGDFPNENFPEFGGSSSGNDIVAYFDTEFSLTDRETITLMGAHTFGGARKTESGYTGMWTQSKNKWNNDYHVSMINPTPLDCVQNAHGDCDLLWDDVTGTCTEPGRCEGWEQIPLRKTKVDDVEIFPRQFQWRHSCNAGQHVFGAKHDNTCTHIMLNADMGLFRDLDDHICKHDNEVVVRGEPCRKGQIKSYPVLPGGSQCNIDDPDQRPLAKCFNPHPTYATMIEADAGDGLNSQGMTDWIDAFGPVFDKVLSHVRSDLAAPPAYGDHLQTLTSPSPTATPTSAPTEALVPNGEDCPCTYLDEYGTNANVFCDECESENCVRTYRPRKGVDTWTCENCKAEGRSCSNSGVCCDGLECLGGGTCGVSA